MTLLRFPSALRSIVAALAAEADRRGLLAYAVGGCVRDWCLGRPTKDLDVVLEADPGPLARWCAQRLRARAEAFDRFGTFRVLGAAGLRVDFARARAETYPAPAALPVVRPSALQDDLIRRDFSINAMAAPLEGARLGHVLDPHGGLPDLRRGVLRVLHPASFRDDPTRLYRAARFAARFGFRLDAETETLKSRAVAEDYCALLSRERLRGELWRLLEEKDPRPALARARAWGLSRHWHPRLSWPPELAAAKDPLERLILLALRMGPRAGAEFARSLHLERPQWQAVEAALEIAKRRASPRGPLSPTAGAALRRLLRPKQAALRPLLVNGEDLRGAGLAPGPRYSAWLDRAARAQWSGEFSTRPEALRWLRRQYGARHRSDSVRIRAARLMIAPSTENG